MLHAIFIRTLKPGATIEDFIEAWVPEDSDQLDNVRTSISASTTGDRQVLTVLEIDATLEEYGALAPTLVKADAWARLDEIVESTQVESVFEEAYAPARFGQS